MQKWQVLSSIDDVYTNSIIDTHLGFKTHKMNEPDHRPYKRPLFQKIDETQKTFYESSLSSTSRIMYSRCDYLKTTSTQYTPVMVVAKNYIPSNTVLYELSGRYFPMAENNLIKGNFHCLYYVNFCLTICFFFNFIGVNDFSIINCSKKKNTPHLLLGPIAYVNHSCTHNTEWYIIDKTTLTLKTTKSIEKSHEITTCYSINYFDDNNVNCMCSSCAQVTDAVKDCKFFSTMLCN